MWRDVLFQRERQPDAFVRRMEQHFDVIHDDWALHGNGKRLAPLLKFPVIDAGGSVSKVNAAMCGQLVWGSRPRLWCEVARRTDDRCPLISGDADRDHVSFDELTQVDAGVETGADEIETALLGRREVEHDVRIIAGEFGQLRCEHHSGCHSRCHETHASRGLIAESGHLVQRPADIGERRSKTTDELLTGFSRRHTAGRSRQQANPDALLKPADGETQG
ncbi:MAG TPA: hypothetical protein VGX46_11110 [Vicinamibacterales bacterium]|nr:hypothetical protein [Vicinamibacterales bacterium]